MGTSSSAESGRDELSLLSPSCDDGKHGKMLQALVLRPSDLVMYCDVADPCECAHRQMMQSPLSREPVLVGRIAREVKSGLVCCRLVRFEHQSHKIPLT